jgi:molecular chaperone DnaJ
VEVLANNLVAEVACAGEGDLVVRQFIAFDRVCSNGWTAYQDRQGMGVACVETRPAPAN